MAAYDIQNLRRPRMFDMPDLSGGSLGEDYLTYFNPKPPPIQAPEPQPQMQTQANREVIDPRASVTEPMRGTNTVDLMDTINRLYTPETQSRDRLNRLLDDAPELQEPSLGRRFVAAMSGFHQGPNASKITQDILDAPNKNTMAAWTAKTGPFQAAYGAENTANINERTLASNVASAQVNEKRYAEQTRVNDEKNRITEIRNKAQAWKLMHPDWDWDTTGPTYVLKNPTTGEITNTGIKTGELSAEDLQLLKNKGSLASSQALAGGRQNIANLNAQIVQDNEGNAWQMTPEGWVARPFPNKPKPGIVRDVKDSPSTAAEKSLTLTQQANADQQKYQATLRAHPEYAGLFNTSRNGMLSLRPRYDPADHYWNDDKDVHDMKLYDEMMLTWDPKYKAPNNIPTKTGIFAGSPSAEFKGGSAPSKPVPPPVSTNPQAPSNAVPQQGSVPNVPKGSQVTAGEPMTQFKPPPNGEIQVRDKNNPSKVFNMTPQEFAIAQQRRPGVFERVR